MKILSCFAGAGGLDLGFERAVSAGCNITAVHEDEIPPCGGIIGTLL